MQNILTLLRLEFKNELSSLRLNNKKTYLNVVGTILLTIVVTFLILLGARLFFKMFDKAGLLYEALVFLFTAMFIFLFISGVSSTTKALYFKGDNEMLMRFPVKGWQIFVSKTIFLLLNQTFITLIIMFPFIKAFTEAVKVGALFYINLPIALILLILIPFLLSNILAIPMMHISNKIRHRFGLIIILLAITMTLFFTIYMLLFEKMVIFLRDSEFSVLSPQVVDVLKNVVLFLVPTKYFADILILSSHRAIGFVVLGSLTLVLFIIATLIILKLYQKTLLKSVEIEGSAFKRKTNNKPKSIFKTLLNKEFLSVFRSVNYSFQYFVLACSMPLMVYFCNKIAIAIGKNDIGSQIVPGLTMLVMLIFSAVIVSFSATSITREGSNFYLTKIIPVSIKTQLAVKFVMYMIVSVLANLITVSIIIIFKQLSFTDGLFVFAIVQLESVALTLRSMRYDIKKPRFNLSGDGELVNNNSNTTRSIMVGFFMSILLGIVGMLLCYLLKSELKLGALVITRNKFMFMISMGITLIFFVSSLLRYSYKLTKTYNKIV